MRSALMHRRRAVPLGGTARRAAGAHSSAGFTLIELMVTVAIIAILSAVAYPNYTDRVVRTRRAAAAGCATELAQFMERVYATNVRYDVNPTAATVLPGVQCRNDLTASYTFAFAASQPTARTFTINATPSGAQATKDTKCATLSLDQANTKAISGTGTAAECWK